MKNYRGYIISYWAKPVPYRGWDWDFAHKDYDGAPDGHDTRCGNAASLQDAKDAIDELIEDEECGDLPCGNLCPYQITCGDHGCQANPK